MPMDETVAMGSEAHWVAAATHSDVPRVRPVSAIGLQFRNPLGLAAGFDRTGRRLPVLVRLGFGHIEVGTLTPARGYVVPTTLAGAHVQIGINIGSAQKGISQQVIDDYLAMLGNIWWSASYIVANLSSPFYRRTGDTPGVDGLLDQLAMRWLDLTRLTGRHVPLLAKISCVPGDDLPRAIDAAREIGLSGVVLASATLQQISIVRGRFESGAIISVGGVASAADIRARLSAGASLVQIHTTFVREGADAARRILAQLESTR